jgi:hypothetical protein
MVRWPYPGAGRGIPGRSAPARPVAAPRPTGPYVVVVCLTSPRQAPDSARRRFDALAEALQVALDPPLGAFPTFPSTDSRPERRSAEVKRRSMASAATPAGLARKPSGNGKIESDQGGQARAASAACETLVGPCR